MNTWDGRLCCSRQARLWRRCPPSSIRHGRACCACWCWPSATSTHRVTNVVLAVVLLAGFAAVFLRRGAAARGGFTIRDWRVWLGLGLFVALIVILRLTV